jgi:ribosomal protein L7/L12
MTTSPEDQIRISQLERKVQHLYEHLGIEPLPPQGSVSEKVRQLVAGGDIVEAIKVHRYETGLDLPSAKQQVEALGL